MTKDELMRRFAELRTEHSHFRDRDNKYGCFNVEGCRSCNYVYNSRGAISCHASDSLIECVQCVDCRNRAYCVGITGSVFAILNKEYPEEDYYRTLRELEIDWNVQTD